MNSQTLDIQSMYEKFRHREIWVEEGVYCVPLSELYIKKEIDSGEVYYNIIDSLGYYMYMEGESITVTEKDNMIICANTLNDDSTSIFRLTKNEYMTYTV